MKFIILFLFISLNLYSSNFLQNIKTTIKNIDKNGNIRLEIPLDKIPNGISGDIFHYYNNEFYAVINKIFIKDKKIILLKNNIENKNIPIIKTLPQVGDTVILGYKNKNSLLISQNRETYRDTLDSYQTTWIHPDVFGIFLKIEKEKKITLKNIKEFSKQYDISLIFISLIDKIIIFDPISATILRKDKIRKREIKKTFFFYTEFKFKSQVSYTDMIKEIVNVK